MPFTIPEGMQDLLTLDTIVESVEAQVRAANNNITPTVIANLAGVSADSPILATAVAIEKYEKLPAGTKTPEQYMSVMGIDPNGNTGKLVSLAKTIVQQIKD